VFKENKFFEKHSKSVLYSLLEIEKIEELMRTCNFCCCEKAITNKIPHCRPIHINVPFNRMGMDFSSMVIGETTVTMFTRIDYYSRFAFANCVKSKGGTAQEVVKILEAQFLTIGRYPTNVQCDNGAQFTSELVKEYFECNGINMIRGAARTPQITLLTILIH